MQKTLRTKNRAVPHRLDHLTQRVGRIHIFMESVRHVILGDSSETSEYLGRNYDQIQVHQMETLRYVSIFKGT